MRQSIQCEKKTVTKGTNSIVGVGATYLARDVDQRWTPSDTVTTVEAFPEVVTPSSKPKAGLPKIADDSVTLVSSMEDPRITIRNSEWATRGWTYQEGMLLKGHLVFTAEKLAGSAAAWRYKSLFSLKGN